MNFLKNLLRQPIRKTLIIIAIAIAASLVLALLRLYLQRVVVAAEYLGGQTLVASFFSLIVSDFYLLSRIVIELSVVLLIAQLIHRLVRKRK